MPLCSQSALGTLVEQTPFEIGNDVVLRKTCSIGFSCFPFYSDLDEPISWEQVADIADKALYAAKKPHAMLG